MLRQSQDAQNFRNSTSLGVSRTGGPRPRFGLQFCGGADRLTVGGGRAGSCDCAEPAVASCCRRARAARRATLALRRFLRAASSFFGERLEPPMNPHTSKSVRSYM
jgi:hypothetical protein